MVTRDERLAELAEKDVQAIGSHCEVQTCNRLDFLPFKCESCKNTYCLDHRTETAHACTHAGEYLSSRAPPPTPSAPRLPSLLSAPCAQPKCKTQIHTPLNPGVTCTRCRKDFCLPHRLEESHVCTPPPPPAATVAATKTKAALSKFRLWGSSKSEKLGTKAADAVTAARGKKAQGVAEKLKMKREAKGDEKVPLEKRCYLYVEAEARSTTSKLPKGVFWFNKEWSVGRVLDQAANQLGVKNENSMADAEEKRLKVFHIEGGRVFSFAEKIGDVTTDGNTIVLLRGLVMPDLME